MREKILLVNTTTHGYVAGFYFNRRPPCPKLTSDIDRAYDFGTEEQAQKWIEDCHLANYAISKIAQ